MRRLFSRRLRRIAAAAAFTASLAAAPAVAQAGPAGDLIRAMADQAVEILATTNENLAEREKRLRAVLARDFDMAAIGRFAMGRYWRLATEEQRAGYIAAFSDFVVATYARRFGGYAGETLEIKSERATGAKDVLVATEITRGSAPPVQAEWRVRVDSPPPRVIDVVVEGVSMSVTQQAEFSSVIRQHGIDGLIHVLQAKAGRLGAQP